MAKSKASQSPECTESLGTWLRRLREAKGVPLRAVAAAAEMDQALLSKIELGQRIPTTEQAKALATYFGVGIREVGALCIAERFRREYANNPAADKAVQILNEGSINE